MAGVIKEAIPRYSIIGQAFFKAKQVQKRSSGEWGMRFTNLCGRKKRPPFLEGRILTSSETRDLLAAKTSAFKFKERQTSKVDREAT